MSLSDAQLQAIEARLMRASGSSWGLSQDDAGNAIIEVNFDDGRREALRVERGAGPASPADITFIAYARRDLARLIEAARGGHPVTDTEIAEMGGRARSASSSPWKHFLESAGGIGGESVIWVSDSDDESDMYLRFGRGAAPDDDYEFVAAARHDIEQLLRHMRDAGQ